jgi:hypothetical protein
LSLLKEKWNKAGVVIFGLSITDEEGSCAKFIKDADNKINYKLYRAPWVMEKFKLELVPALLVFDADGNFLHNHGLTIDESLAGKTNKIPSLEEILK